MTMSRTQGKSKHKYSGKRREPMRSVDISTAHSLSSTDQAPTVCLALCSARSVAESKGNGVRLQRTQINWLPWPAGTDTYRWYSGSGTEAQKKEGFILEKNLPGGGDMRPKPGCATHDSRKMIRLTDLQVHRIIWMVPSMKYITTYWWKPVENQAHLLFYFKASKKLLETWMGESQSFSISKFSIMGEEEL